MSRWWHRLVLRHRQSPWLTLSFPKPPRKFWRCSCGREWERA
jgi:hypothetical protein